MKKITKACSDNYIFKQGYSHYNGVPLVVGKTDKELDRSYNLYQFASNDVKKHIDELSIFMYGENNTQRYLRLKADLKNKSGSVVSTDESIDNPYMTVKTFKEDEDISFEGFFSELEILQADFDDKPVQTGFIDNNSNRWNSIWENDGKRYREKVETLIIKGDSVYLAFINEKKYNIPGGSSEPNKTLSEQAACECKEEARILIDNIRYFTTYDYEYNETELKRQPFCMRTVPEDKRWIGKHIHLFVANYAGDFKGYVEKQDRDYLFTRNGRFYNIKKIYSKLRPEHQLALKEFVIDKKDGE